MLIFLYLLDLLDIFYSDHLVINHYIWLCVYKAIRPNYFNICRVAKVFRLFLAIPILLILYLIIFKNNFFSNSIFLFYLSGIIISQWIFELQLLKHEVKKTFKIFYIYSFVSFLFLFTLLIFFIAKLETSYVLLSYLIFLSSYLALTGSQKLMLK